MLALMGGAIGAIGLLGWLAGWPLLTQVFPGQPQMVPNSGLALALLAVAGALRAREGVRGSRRTLSLVAAAVVLVIGAGTLAQYGLGVDLHLDGLLLGGRLGPHAGRPSPLTALAVTALAAALLLFDSRPTAVARPSEWLIVVSALTGIVALVGLLYDVAPLYRLITSPAIGVSLPTMVAILSISIGLLLERPRGGVMRVVVSRGPGSLLLKRLVLPAIVVPLVLGLVIIRVLAGPDPASVPLVVALLVTSMTVVSLVGLAVIAVPLNRAHDAIDSARARYRDLVEYASDGIFVADLAGRYTEVNAAGCKLLGLPPDEIVGKTIVDFLPDEQVERLAAAREELLQGGVQVAEWRLRHRDGHFVPVEVSAKILADGRWQGFVRDITVRRRAEEQARAARARLEGIISIAADAIISIDEDQRIVLYNQGAEAIFGWSRDEALGRPVDILIPERLRDGHRTYVRRFADESVESRRMAQRDVPILGLRKTGEEFPAEAAISKISLATGTIYTVTLRDVSQRWQREQAIRLSEERLRVALQASPVAVFNQDRELRYTWVHNPRGPYAGERILGLTDADLLPEEEAEPIRTLKAGVVDSGHGARGVVRTTIDGEPHYFDLIVEPLRDKTDAMVGITGAAWDVTEQRRADEQLRFLARGGEVLMSAARDLDPALTRLGELAVGEIADCFLVEVLEGSKVRHLEIAHCDPSRAPLADGLATRREQLDRLRAHFGFEARESLRATLVNDDAAELPASAPSPESIELLRSLGMRSIVGVPLVARGRHLGSMILMTASGPRYDQRDRSFVEEAARITALAIDNAQLYQAAQKAIAAREQVLGIVAHDLRNPLSAVLMQLEMLRRPGGAPERRSQRVVLAIERAGRRMNRLLQDMLDVAHLEAGPLPIIREVVDTSAMVDDVVESHQAHASDAGLRVRLDIAGALPTVLGDRDRLLQVFDNLIGNAIKFTPAGGEIVLGATASEGEVLFWVKDNGSGISDDQVARLFDRFWQANRSDRRGAGLGLSIVKAIVEAHGGRVWVESELGRGSTFYVTVPRVPRRRAAGPEPAASPAARHP